MQPGYLQFVLNEISSALEMIHGPQDRRWDQGATLTTCSAAY
jgi:hypothetical protein